MNIELTDKEKIQITNPEAVFSIMQRILLRENEIDIEKEHFWIIGLNTAGYILYIELVSLGSVWETIVEPMNVYRIAVMKNASRVIAVHNHPSGALKPSDSDKDTTDRLIQVGRILNITLEDHLIISPVDYLSFKREGIMAELELSTRYVPSYQLIERIRQEEKAIAKEAVDAAKDIAKAERDKKEQILFSAVNFLLEKGIPVKQIAEILGVTVGDVERVLKKKK